MEFPTAWNPSNEELVNLIRHKNGLSTSPNILIKDGFLDPSEIEWSHVSNLKDNERYYFLKRRQLAPTSDRVQRKGATGTWGAATGQTDIFDNKKRVVALKAQLDFKIFNDASKSAKNSSKSRWIMHEILLCSDTFQEWAVCRIKNNAKNKSLRKIVVAVDDDEASDFKFAADLKSILATDNDDNNNADDQNNNNFDYQNNNIDDQEAPVTKRRRNDEEVLPQSVQWSGLCSTDELLNDIHWNWGVN